MRCPPHLIKGARNEADSALHAIVEIGAPQSVRLLWALQLPNSAQWLLQMQGMHLGIPQGGAT